MHPMNTSVATSSNTTRYLTAILLAGIISGSLDLTFAFTFHGLRSGIGPIRILQSIASGWLGTDSFQDGIPAAALYLIAMLRMRWMTAHAYLYGMAYGVAIYLVMNFVVLPLSNAPHFKATVLGTTCDLSMHVLVIGPAIALSLKRFAKI
jgi:hypothetical protein